MQQSLFHNSIAFDIHQYDLVIINSSGGKDSVCAIWEMCRIADATGYNKAKMHISHQELGKMEWKGTSDLVAKQAAYFGLPVHFTRRRNQEGYEENLLEYARRRGKWPSSTHRWCTSDYKRAPGARVVTALTKDLATCKVLYVFGFRAEESPSRMKKEVLATNKMLTTKKRHVDDYLPVHDWSLKKVWQTINKNKLPTHNAYALGMPRLSCVFCIFSPFDALVLAAQSNRELLDEYIEVEREIGHDFRHGFKIESVKTALENGYQPKVKDWVM